MMYTQRRSSLIIRLVAIALSAPAAAQDGGTGNGAGRPSIIYGNADYQMQITGTVTGVTADPVIAPNMSAQFAAGDPVSVTLVYDGNVQATPRSINADRYLNVVTSINGSIDDYLFELSSTPTFNQIDLINASAQGDVFGLYASVERVGVGDPVLAGLSPWLGLLFIDPDDTAFIGDFNQGATAPPSLTNSIDFDAFDNIFRAQLIFGDDSTIGQGRVDFLISSISATLIPEPTSSALLALCGLIVMRRRR